MTTNYVPEVAHNRLSVSRREIADGPPAGYPVGRSRPAWWSRSFRTPEGSADARCARFQPDRVISAAPPGNQFSEVE
jgi:hypothetical protein